MGVIYTHIINGAYRFSSPHYYAPTYGTAYITRHAKSNDPTILSYAQVKLLQLSHLRSLNGSNEKK